MHAALRKKTVRLGWAIGLFTFLIYFLTLARTVSFWDCGEFIATSYTMGVGHPPGAPLYQLLAHCFTLIASDPTRIAFWSNLLSALAAGATNMFLFWTICHAIRYCRPQATGFLAASVGSLCYAFCDTAWFSAVESEVYSLAMLLASVAVWATMRWSISYRSRLNGSARWVLLIALLEGMGVCVHEMVWLTIPAILVVMAITLWPNRRELRISRCVGVVSFALFFFLLGLTPYVIIPLRAASNPTINNTNPSTAEAFETYIKRKQYENGPVLYPRIWRKHPGDDKNYAEWSGFHGKEIKEDGTVEFKPNVLDNLQFLCTYQLGCMYFRYIGLNYCGRNFYELLCLPLLLALLGLWYHWKKHRKGFWSLFTLFFFGGIGLAIYLNMPCYQPRERDYAFVLSFFAIAIWIGMGVEALVEWVEKKGWNERWASWAVMLVPALMLVMNYHYNDRSHNNAARDTAINMLSSCEPNAILFTVGDNDTFPLWYIQEVEKFRRDVRVINLTLLTTKWYAEQNAPECVDEEGNQLRGYRAFAYLLENHSEETPVYFTYYGWLDYRSVFPDRLQLSGICYRLADEPTEEGVATEEAYRHVAQSLQWTTPASTYLDITGKRFHQRYQGFLKTIADTLDARNNKAEAALVREKI